MNDDLDLTEDTIDSAPLNRDAIAIEVGDSGDDLVARPDTVLIVDDDPNIRYALRLMFELDEFIVVGEAGNGAEALHLVIRHLPRFVILDYHMPTVNGEEAAGLIRSVSPDSHIVAFSAVLTSKPAWADSYLNKDRIGEVVPLLVALLSGKSSSALAQS